MSLTLSERIELVEQASAERARARLREADAALDDGIRFVMCPCLQCALRREWIHSQKRKPVVSREVLRNVGIALLGAAAAIGARMWR